MGFGNYTPMLGNMALPVSRLRPQTGIGPNQLPGLQPLQGMPGQAMGTGQLQPLPGQALGGGPVPPGTMPVLKTQPNLGMGVPLAGPDLSGANLPAMGAAGQGMMDKFKMQRMQGMAGLLGPMMLQQAQRGGRRNDGGGLLGMMGAIGQAAPMFRGAGAPQGGLLGSLFKR